MIWECYKNTNPFKYYYLGTFKDGADAYLEQLDYDFQEHALNEESNW